ncbi:hypothetical protein LL033_11835 [Clostridium estertheticum]|uniref:hypothetical protein n=1 Tax=Clostridium estertheticum TaxID=238834 RepID=UPI001C0DF09D|nr:hypothetical protein [Clostridium estertheticum]MBU3215842.1 hypothetical protein [Clostridium estertheticum]WAG57797.1 hypothetical protein LL033_11835 [Clostridium estertheticum]
MSDQVKVNPTPIQRNINDVAMELTELYYSASNGSEYTVEKIQQTYRKFYATAELMTSTPSEELKKI